MQWDLEDRPLFNERGQRCGNVFDGWFYKNVITSVHQLRRPPAWAIDTAHLADLEANGGKGVILFDEQGTTWTATLERFKFFGKPFNRNHGDQVYLLLKYWQVTRLGQPPLLGIDPPVGPWTGPAAAYAQ